MTSIKHHYVTVYYTLDDLPFDDYLHIETDGRFLTGGHLESVANDCAQDYYDSHDGWERRDWNEGVTFTLWRGAGEELGQFNVVMESVPRFTSYLVYEVAV